MSCAVRFQRTPAPGVAAAHSAARCSIRSPSATVLCTNASSAAGATPRFPLSPRAIAASASSTLARTFAAPASGSRDRTGARSPPADSGKDTFPARSSRDS